MKHETPRTKGTASSLFVLGRWYQFIVDARRRKGGKRNYGFMRNGSTARTTDHAPEDSVDYGSLVILINNASSLLQMGQMSLGAFPWSLWIRIGKYYYSRGKKKTGEKGPAWICFENVDRLRGRRRKEETIFS